jgi:hypothetical protein
LQISGIADQRGRVGHYPGRSDGTAGLLAAGRRST